MHEIRTWVDPHEGLCDGYCVTCGWTFVNKTELSAVVAVDHHQIETMPNPRDRLLFLRVLIPANVVDHEAKMQIIKAINLHTDCGITGIPFWG